MKSCPKTTTRPLTLPGVVPESGESRSRKQDISSGTEQIVRWSDHLEMLARLFRKGTKSDARKEIDRERHVFSGNSTRTCWYIVP